MTRAVKLTLAGVLTATIALMVGQGRPFAGHINLKPTAPGALYKFDAEIINNSLAVSPDERLAVASYSLDPGVKVYDLKTKRLVTTLSGFVTPRNILFTPDGKHFLVSDSTGGTVAIIDTATLKTTASIPIGAGAFGTAIDAEGKRLYVNNQAANTVTVVDLLNCKIIAVLTGFSQPRQGLKLDRAGTRLFVTNFTGDKITIVETETLKSVQEITGFKGIRAVSITDDGTTLYAANSNANSISVVDLKTGTIRASVSVGKDPYGAALSPDGRRVYSGDKTDNTLTVIDTDTNKAIGTITGFNEPRQAIVFGQRGFIAYVLNKDLSIAVVDLNAQKITYCIGAGSTNGAFSRGSEKTAATGKADSVEKDSRSSPRKLRTERTIMKVFALGSFAKPLTDEQRKRILPKEVPDTLRLYLDGKIDQFWFREDKPGGVVFLMNSKSVEEAKSIVEALPLAADGYLVFEYIPVGPLKPLGLLISPPNPSNTDE
jgi:YVTN family beta-propeller protein